MVSISPSSPSYPTPTSPPAGGMDREGSADMDLGESDAGSPRSADVPGLSLTDLGPSASMQVELVNGEVRLKWEAAGSLAAPSAVSPHLTAFSLPAKPVETLPSPALSSLPSLPAHLPPKPSAAAALPHPAPRAPFGLPARPSTAYTPSSTYQTIDVKPAISPSKREITSPASHLLALKPESPCSPPPTDEVKPVELPETTRIKREASISSVPSRAPVASTSASPSPSDAEDGSPSGSTSEEESSRSRSASPKKPSTRSTNTSPRKGKGKRVKQEEPEAQLIGHLPLANDEALSTFIEVSNCTYASKALGDLAYFDSDSAQCDCTHYDGIPELQQACGEESSCMNRLMQIECVQGDCKCGENCQNQRFQRKEYAPIDIVKTEKKGFGVRTREDLAADTFVYEYVGEVIGPTAFAKRMKGYAEGGIRHFYFMALDREVFIDATKKGGKGRFLNHSCNPNCFVAKWTIGKKMRMGIFAKRDIKANEELTFNYNVDRYGHVAQPCFCGEANCVGFIGGKTQTDIGGMDDLYIDALGITEEVEALGLRGTKKKKSKKLDEDFLPTLHPIDLEEVPKVAAAVRQAIQTRRILEKLLHRIQMTADEEVRTALLRLHGFSLMGHILKEYSNDIRIITLDLEILGGWSLKVRNKVEDSKIEESVRKCAKMGEKNISKMATDLLDYWNSLELGYRIPKSAREVGEDGERKRAAEFTIEQIAAKRARYEETVAEEMDHRRPAFVKPVASIGVRAPPAPILPAGWRVHHDDSQKAYYENLETGEVQWDFPKPPPEVVIMPKAAPAPVDVNAIIAQVQKEADEAAAREAAKVKEEERAAKDAARKRAGGTPNGSARGSKADAAAKEKKLLGLFSTIVVQVMSKYRDHLEPEQFKKRAREVTVLLCEKEKKHPLYASETYDSLSSDKTAKVKAFTKDWVKKLIDRKRALNSTGAPEPGAVTPSLTTPSPQTPGASTATNFASSPFFMPPTPSAIPTNNGDPGASSPRFPPPQFRADQQSYQSNGTPLSRPPINGYTSGGIAPANGFAGNGSPSWDPRRGSNGSSVGPDGRQGSWSSTASSRPGTSQGGFSAQEQRDIVGEVMNGLGNGSPAPLPSPGLYGVPRENSGRW